MKIDQPIREKAIIDVFINERAMPHGRLLLADLTTAWRASGLRADDLEVGMDEMLDQGLLSLESSTDGPLALLTQKCLDKLTSEKNAPRRGSWRQRLQALTGELSESTVLARAKARKRLSDYTHQH